jgi:hypothetical protein
MNTNLPPTPWKNDDWSDSTLEQIAEHLAQHLPKGWEIEATFMNGSFNVLIESPTHLYAADDLADEPATATAAEQLKCGFEFAMKYGAAEAA